MPVKEEVSLVVNPDGVCEHRVDRVLLAGDPPAETRRLKVSRRQTGAAHVFDQVENRQILPAGCRFVLPYGNEHYLVIEQPPQVRLVRWRCRPAGTWDWLRATGRLRKYGLTSADASRETFTLAFPYVIFIVFMNKDGIGNVHGYYRTEPLRTLDDPLMHMGITNYYESGNICMGNNKPARYRTWAEGIEMVLAHFWQSCFNSEMSAIYHSYTGRIPEMRTIWDWEYWSLRNPSWPLAASWNNSGRTLRSFLQAPVSDQSSLFRLLVSKAASAPEWRDGEPLVKQGEFVPSASLSAIVGSLVLRQGDILTATANQDGFRKGQSYRIEHFFELENSHRRAKLEGIDGPVCLHCLMTDRGGKLLVLSQQANVAQSDFFIAPGIPLIPGLRFKVSSTEDFPSLRTGHMYRVVETRRDADRDMCVRVEGFDGWIYVTSQGRLLSSVCFLIPLLEGSTFQYGDKQITVGEVVKVTQSPNERLPSGMVARVSAIKRDASGAFFVEFEGVSGRHTLMNAAQEMCLEWKPWAYEVSERKIVFGEHALDLTFGSHLLPIKPESGLSIGHLYRVLASVQSTVSDRHPMDLDLVVQYGNAPIPLIRQSKWVLNPATFLMATDTFTHGEMVLRRGSILRHVGGATELFGKNEDLQIAGFVPSVISGVTEAVFENGVGITLCEQFIGQAFRRFDGGAWKDVVAPAFMGDATFADRSRGDLRIGEYAILMNGEGLRENSRYVGHICVLKGGVDRYDRSGYQWRVIFLSDPEQKLREIAGDRLAGLGNIVARKHFKPVPRVRGGRAPFDLHHPQAFAMYREGPPQGRLEAGKDCHGRDIHVGDIVKPVRETENVRSDRRLPSSGIGKEFLVVGRGRLGGDRDFFLYLLAGEYRSSNSLDSGIYGFDELPSDLRRPEMLRDMVLHMSKDCDLVEMVTLKPVFQTGRVVRVRDGVVPRYGWGKVKAGEHGQVTACCDEEVQVQFENEPEWIGCTEELELAPVPGVSVRILNPRPRHGLAKVTMESVGVLRQADPDCPDLFLVDFPGHQGFYAYLDELEIL